MKIVIDIFVNINKRDKKLNIGTNKKPNIIIDITITIYK